MTQTHDSQSHTETTRRTEERTLAAGAPAPGAGLFHGASRVQRYVEPPEAEMSPHPMPQPGPSTTPAAAAAQPASTRPTTLGVDTGQRFAAPPAPASARTGQGRPTTGGARAHVHLGAVRPPSGPHTPVTAAARGGVRPAQWGTRGRWNRASAGILKLAPSEDERAHRDALVTIRRATWTRAVNVMVTNPKGGSGKTPTSLILGGILGHIRGGYVVVWEAAESVGSLARRAEGEPSRGLSELIETSEHIHSAGNLGGYIAPQTSHTDVIGSVADRPVLTAQNILSTREVLDTYYRLTITDTGNNPHHEAYQAALRTADAVVLPCLVSLDSLAGLEEALSFVHAADTTAARTGSSLSSRVVVVLSHDGGPEDSHIAKALHERLLELGVFAVAEVPFDPAIRLGGEITVADLSEDSTRAWTAAAAAVVRALGTAPTDVNLVAELANELEDQASATAAHPSVLTS